MTVILQANETHVHLGRGQARDAAIDLGLDLDDLHIYRADTGFGVMRWGWTNANSPAVEAAELAEAAEEEFGPLTDDLDSDDDQSAEAIMARNAERLGETSDDELADDDALPSVAEPSVVSSVTDGEVIQFTMSDGSVQTVSTDGPEPAPTAYEPDVTSAEALLPPDPGSYDGEVFLRFGPYSFFHLAKAEATAMAKKLKADVEIVTAAGVTLLAVSQEGKSKAKAEKAPKPAKPLPLGAQVDEYDRPVRPVIAQEKWVKICAGHFDKIEARAGDAAKLLEYQDSINPGDTYRQIIYRYAVNHRRYATKYGRSPFAPEATAPGWDQVSVAANDSEVMADAAD